MKWWRFEPRLLVVRKGSQCWNNVTLYWTLREHRHEHPLLQRVRDNIAVDNWLYCMWLDDNASKQ